MFCPDLDYMHLLTLNRTKRVGFIPIGDPDCDGVKATPRGGALRAARDQKAYQHPHHVQRLTVRHQTQQARWIYHTPYIFLLSRRQYRFFIKMKSYTNVQYPYLSNIGKSYLCDYENILNGSTLFVPSFFWSFSKA